MTLLPFPYVVSNDGERLDAQGVQGNFDALARAGGLQIMAGIVSTSYTASNTSASATVPHGFGRPPLAVIATSPDNGRIAHAVGSTSNLSISSETRDGATITGTVSVNYAAFF